MLKVLLYAAIIALMTFAVAFVGLSAWRSFEQNQQAEQTASDTDTKGKTYEVVETQRTEKAIARYNLWLSIFTGVLAFVGLIQIGFLISADTTANRAANAAKTAADASKQSADVARQALIAGQRAFVSVGNWLNVARKKVDTGEVVDWGFRVQWQNAGNTPTRNMLNHVNLRLSNTNLPGDWDFPDYWGAIPGQIKPTQLGVAPKGTIDSDTLSISVSDLDDVVHERKFLHFWGWATYDDVFPGTEKHVTRFAVRITAGGDATNPDRMSFHYDWLDKYNCADEECARGGHPANWTSRTATE